MRWTHKAAVQRACASLPGGEPAYRALQRRFGTLTGDPFRRLPAHARMIARLRALDVDLDGARCLEVGTGHVPVFPVACLLLGAREVVTVDLHRRLDLILTRTMVRQLSDQADRVVELYDGLVDEGVLRKRLGELSALTDRPGDLLGALGVRYIAPGDAAALREPNGSYDLHFSVTVLEHIGPPVLADVLAEARRLLRPGGVAAHLIDPSDHFAHQDPSITAVNFLRFDESRWDRIAGNQFSYTNRLRASQLIDIVEKAGFTVEHADRVVDSVAMEALRDPSWVHRAFAGMTAEDLATTTLDVYARPR